MDEYLRNLIVDDDMYVTGSNSKFLSSDITTKFKGSGDKIRVYHLSFSFILFFIWGR